MKSAFNKGDNATTGYMPPVKPLVPEMGYILLSHWPRCYHDHHPLTIGCFPQPIGKALLLKTPLTCVIEHV